MRKEFLERIISMGITIELTMNELKEVKLTNGIALIMALSGFVMSVFILSMELVTTGRLSDSITLIAFAPLIILLTLSPVYLNYKGFNFLAKLTIMLVCWITFTVFSVVYGKDSRIDQYFFVLLLVPAFLCSQKRYIFLGIGITVILILGLNIYYVHFPPLIEITGTYANYPYFIHNLSTVAAIVSFSLYYRKQNDYSETKLSNEMHEHKETSEQLYSAIADKDKFFSIIAHDLKGPIGNMANLLNYIDLNKIKPELLSQLQISAQNTYELIEDLLTWARAQKDHIEIEPSNFNLYKLFEKLVSTLQFSAQEKSLELLVPKNENDIFVYADIPSINTVLRNLVSNSIKFTNEGGSIKIAAKVINEKVKISVSDTGIGISKDILSKLFKIGSKITSPGTRNERGTGLGLLLCKEFIELNKGEIGVESEPGKGSTFWFTLPLGEAIDLDNLLAIVKGKQMKTLVVEDNYLNLQNTIAEISSANIDFDIAKDGNEAIDKGMNKEYDFILMDIDLPIKNGVEANKAIRTKYPDARIIALSSYNKSEIQQKDIEVYFDNYLKKPLVLDNLLYTLKEIIPVFIK